MTADIRGLAVDSAAAGVASKGALIATFYSYREAALDRLLIERLRESLDLEPEDDDPRLWCNPAKKTMLIRIDPETAHDATITQLALNVSGNAADAWDEMRQQLEAVQLKSILKIKDLRDYWGCTLTYHAVLNPGVNLDPAMKELLPAVRRLHSSEGPRSSLAQADMWGGRVWLVDFPDPGDGWTAATVYVALNPSDPPDQARAFVPKVIYGRTSALLMPDLISHKGYHQMRQYRARDLDHLYKESVNNLRNTTRQLLGELGQQAVRTSNLNQLARKYNSLLSVASDLNEVRLYMVRHLHNYDRWRTALEDNRIIEFHRRRLETANLELELMMEELRDALETADKAVSVAQVQVDKELERTQREAEEERRKEAREQEDRHRRMVIFVAVVTAVLTVPGLLNQQAVAALPWWLLGMRELNPLSPPDVRVILLIQVIMIVVVAFLFFLFWVIVGKLTKLVRKLTKPREKTRSGDREAS